MRRYYFHLRDGYRGYADRSGVSLPSDEAAREHADCVATELMKNRERKVRHWRIQVRDAQGKRLFEVPFIGLDRTLSHLSPPLKKAMEELSQRCYALREAIADARASLIQASALLAKSRGRPYLATDDGEEIVKLPSRARSRSVV
jgi:hypothetical protein